MSPLPSDIERDQVVFSFCDDVQGCNDLTERAKQMVWAVRSTADLSGDVAGPSGDVAGPSGDVAGSSGDVAGSSYNVAGSSGDVAGSPKQMIARLKSIVGRRNQLDGPTLDLFLLRLCRF